MSESNELRVNGWTMTMPSFEFDTETKPKIKKKEKYVEIVKRFLAYANYANICRVLVSRKIY